MNHGFHLSCLLFQLQLQGYLKSVLNCPFYRNHQETVNLYLLQYVTYQIIECVCVCARVLVYIC